MPYTLVYYESPHRLEAFLKDALEILGDRPAALANDLTKMFERVSRGSLSELLTLVQAEAPLGEYCVVIQAAGSPQKTPS
jgi:16S rRNA (cytidine1402-2'-O)-methyltransferase